MLDGVPMNWMTRWSSPFPPYVAEAHGARFTCVDGHDYIDFCLGDTGAMTGHSPEASVAADRRPGGARHHDHAADRGLALGGRASSRAASACSTGSSRSRRPTPTASPCASRATSRGGPKILVYNYCYHGSVDETIITINDGVPGPKPGNAGPPVDPTVTTKVIEWNDLDGARAGARARRRGLRPRRAGPDQHRHHPAGRGLPRRAARG